MAPQRIDGARALGRGLALALLLAAPGARAEAPSTEAVPGEPVFQVNRYQVSGNTLLSPAELEAVLAPHLGAGRRFADIEAARQALRAAYLERGYTLIDVSLPEQEITSGTVELQVRASRVGGIEVVGARHHDADNIRASLPGLAEGAVPNTTRLAESLRVANESTVKQTQMLFKAGEAPGQVDAVIRVEDTPPAKTFVALDNTGNAQTGEARLGIGWQHGNLFNRDHVLTLQYLTAPSRPEDMAVIGLGYRLPLYRQADVIDLFAGYSSVDAGVVTGVVAGVQGDLRVIGKGVLAGARYTLNLAKRSPIEHRLVFALDWRAFSDSLNQADVTIHPASLNYLGLWQTEGTRLGYQAGVSVNLPGGSHGGDADFAAARAGADAGYVLARLGGNLTRALAGDWQLGAVLEGQYTGEPLVPGEQFGLGGAASVRGFGERLVSGDRGWRAGLELTGPDLGAKTGISDAHLRLSAFVEGGAARRLNPQPGDVEREGILGLGLGFSLSVGRNLSARLDYGRVADGGGGKRPGDGRLHLRLSWVF